jgi:hypothetical protein
MESLTAVGFGVVYDQVATRVTQKLPGGISADVGVLAAGALIGFFGQKVGLGADVRDPILMGTLALAGAKGSRLARAGTLMKPSQWGSAVGGYDGFAAGGAAPAVAAGRNWAPGVRRLGRGGMGMQSIYNAYPESGGVAS